MTRTRERWRARERSEVWALLRDKQGRGRSERHGRASEGERGSGARYGRRDVARHEGGDRGTGHHRRASEGERGIRARYGRCSVARVGVDAGGEYIVQGIRGSGAAGDGDGRRRWRHYTGLREGARGTQATRPSRYNDEEALRRRRLGACGEEEGRQIERGKPGKPGE